MSGTTYICHIFAGDTTSSWTAAEREAAMNKVREAYQFLGDQARRHGFRVTFMDETKELGTYEPGLPVYTFVNPRWTGEVIRQATGDDAVAHSQSLREELRADNVLYCIHVDKPGLSYNLAYYAGVPNQFRAERMICFSHYPDGRPTATATYAHEILHLFGAGDLYFPYDADESRKQVAAQRFPDDVMYRVDYDLRKLNVGRFTAYRVGWQAKLEDGDHLFED